MFQFCHVRCLIVVTALWLLCLSQVDWVWTVNNRHTAYMCNYTVYLLCVIDGGWVLYCPLSCLVMVSLDDAYFFLVGLQWEYICCLFIQDRYGNTQLQFDVLRSCSDIIVAIRRLLDVTIWKYDGNGIDECQWTLCAGHSKKSRASVADVMPSEGCAASMWMRSWWNAGNCLR